jgi:drug/metabolite transporter (DMT)-like permease
VIGVLLAWVMLGERIGLSGALGGAAVLAGVALTSQRVRDTHARPEKAQA